MKTILLLVVLSGCATANPMTANRKACVMAYGTLDFGLMFSYMLANHKIMDDDKPKSPLYENTMATVFVMSGLTAFATGAAVRNYAPENYQCR